MRQSAASHRLAHYCLDLAELYSVERVVPVVIFLRDGKHIPPRLSLGSERRSLLILFGSYARGDWVEERVRELQSMAGRLCREKIAGFQ